MYQTSISNWSQDSTNITLLYYRHDLPNYFHHSSARVVRRSLVCSRQTIPLRQYGFTEERQDIGVRHVVLLHPMDAVGYIQMGIATFLFVWSNIRTQRHLLLQLQRQLLHNAGVDDIRCSDVCDGNPQCVCVAVGQTEVANTTRYHCQQQTTQIQNEGHRSELEDSANRCDCVVCVHSVLVSTHTHNIPHLLVTTQCSTLCTGLPTSIRGDDHHTESYAAHTEQLRQPFYLLHIQWRIQESIQRSQVQISWTTEV